MDQRLRAVGAVAAQFSQALSSFAVTVAALRSLEPAVFGRLSILLGGLVLATALMTGVVGDSLTVLDRGARPLRAGLQLCCLGLAGGMLLVGLLLSRAAGGLSWREALLYGCAVSVFALEDTVRRLLMANLRFWFVVIIDLVYLLAAAGVLGVASLVAGRLHLADFLLAVLVGQAVAAVVGVGLLPSPERVVVGRAGADIRAVLAFGGWRALQQTLRPLSLTLVRSVVAAVLGAAALGRLEAARVYTSPALLLVQGTGGFLLATYARDRGRPARQAVRSADRTMLGLVLASLALGGVAVLVLPLLGAVLSTKGTVVEPLPVLAWSLYAAAVAATMPYASLAAVRGRQALVVLLRGADTAVGVLAAAVGLALSGSAAAAPVGLAAGGLLGALLQRRVAAGAVRGPAATRVDPTSRADTAVDFVSTPAGEQDQDASGRSVGHATPLDEHGQRLPQEH